MAFYMHVQAATNGFKMNDVIETDVIGFASSISRAAYTIYSILEITAVLYFPVIITRR